MSVPQSNSTHTNDTPLLDDERTRRTSVAPFTAVSIGNVTSRSTSSAAMPPASVITTTVGAVRSGKTSMSIRSAAKSPASAMAAAPASTVSRLWMECFIMLLMKFIVQML